MITSHTLPLLRYLNARVPVQQIPAENSCSYSIASLSLFRSQNFLELCHPLLAVLQCFLLAYMLVFDWPLTFLLAIRLFVVAFYFAVAVAVALVC